MFALTVLHVIVAGKGEGDMPQYTLAFTVEVLI